VEKPRILVADDDAWILRMVTTVLEKRGYLVETACDGEDAYEKALANPPQLLITDVMMPNMDGWSLVKALRGQPKLAFVPVIFLSALGSDDDRIRGFRLGADDYLPKPFRFEELDLRVAKTMEKTEALKTQLHQQETQSDTNKAKAALSGNLAEVGLSSLLVLLDMDRKTGVLKVTREESEEQATLYLRKGTPVAAEMDYASEQIRNKEVIYAMLAWDSGEFAFYPQEVNCETQIQLSTTALLLEGARIIDEACKPA